MDSIAIKINEVDMEIQAGVTILEAARKVGFEIPTLCYLKEINEIGACRMCMVEVKGVKELVPSCVTRVSAGMEILTNSPAVQESRRTTLDLLCADHKMDCEFCPRYSDCEFHVLIRAEGLEDRKYSAVSMGTEEDTSSVHLVWDGSRCVQCRRCEAVCRAQSVNVIGLFGRGSKSKVGPALPLGETDCVHCGQCIAMCPTGALYEKNDTRFVWKALANHKKHVVAAVSPFVEAQLGELFLDPIGTNAAGKIAALLRRIGFERVFSTKTAAKELAKAEGAELRRRLEEGIKLPMISTTCPSWVEYCMTRYPELAANMSGCTNITETFGPLCRKWYADHEGIDPKDVFVVSIEPCTAGKYEEVRLGESGNIDLYLTTRELAALIKRGSVSRFTALSVWRGMPDEDYDTFTEGDMTAASVFDSYGDVMDAAFRAAGCVPVRKDEWEFNGRKLITARIDGLGGAVKLIADIKAGKTNYAFIEVMACPGGCLNGGGQPHQSEALRSSMDIRAKRAEALL
jgi:NADP-reducing hydrogenase subunit HndD